MRVYLPTDNPQSRGYSSTHKGYDFRGLNLPDEVRSGADGEIVQRVDIYTTNWQTTGALGTRDYGNYIKVKHTDGTFALFAHLRKGSSFNIGTKVSAGQTIARIGNTGNSTGPHLHAEYRNASNINEPAEFYNKVEPQQDTSGGQVLDKATFEKLVNNSNQADSISDYLKLDRNKSDLAKITIGKFEDSNRQLQDSQNQKNQLEGKVRELEGEVQILQRERDEANTKKCPNPNAHNANNSSGDGDSDLPQPPVPDTTNSDGNTTNSNNPQGSGQKNFLEALIDTILRWGK